ncbi:MAG TPA: hypothetical protein VJH63_01525 [Candidatus Paceibacterota bacterium]
MATIQFRGDTLPRVDALVESRPEKLRVAVDTMKLRMPGLTIDEAAEYEQTAVFEIGLMGQFDGLTISEQIAAVRIAICELFE